MNKTGSRLNKFSLFPFLFTLSIELSNDAE